MGAEITGICFAMRLLRLRFFLTVLLLGASRVEAQTPALTSAPALLAQCESNPNDIKAISACQMIIQDSTQTQSTRAKAYGFAGNDALDENQPGLALEYFNKALAMDPASDVAYSGRANVEFVEGQYDLAVADALKAIKLSPGTHPEAYLVLGTLADRDGNHDARIDYMTKAIEILPSYAAAYAGRGHGYMDEKKFTQALADFNKAISLQPTLAASLKPNFVIVYIERASDSMNLGRYQAGIEDLTKAIQLDEQNARALGDLGDAYNATQQYDKALVVLTKDIAINPDYAFSYSDRGVTYLNIGKLDQALADLNKAIQLGDTAATTYFVRGEVYQLQSNKTAALKDYQKSLELSPPGDPYRSNIQQAIAQLEQ
jgi:tetratricopeptide (TPR) repeat protein